MSEKRRQPETMAIAGDEPKDEKKPLAPEEALLQKARKEWLGFSHRFEGVINGYFGTPDMQFTMKPGGWYIDLEKIQVNADPAFFIEKGYSEGEALFATFHEAEHFRDMVFDTPAYGALFDRIKTRTDVHAAYPKALQRFYNCLEDVMVNRVVMSRWKAGSKAKDSLYPKLFPQNDFRGQPHHRQLMYALLRKAMLPNEEVHLDPEVAQTLDAWQIRGGSQKTLDTITATDPRGKARLSAGERYARIEATLEPIFEAMYQRDLEHHKPPEKQKGENGEPDEQKPGEPGESDPFGDDPNEDAIPDPIDFDKAAEQAQRINDRIAQKKKDDFKELMGVEQKDFDSYRRDYEKIKDHIADLSRVWDDIIQRRKTVRRILRKNVKEGPMLNPRNVATGVAEIKAGHMDPTIFLDYEKQEVIRNRPNRIEITVVCDGSGSMDQEGGKKATMQRLVAVLAAEALVDFRERVAKERRAGEKIDLAVKSEVRMFANTDEVLKPLSESLSHAERVAMHKRLKNIPKEGNNEPASFQAIEQEQFHVETITALEKGDLKKIIVFLTDGESDVVAIQAHIKQLYQRAGQGRENLVIAAIGFEGGTSAVTTYAPNGFYADDLKAVPEIFKQFIATILADV